MKNKREKLKLVRRIMALAVEISAGSEWDVWVRYSGHVQNMEVEFHTKGALYNRHWQMETWLNKEWHGHEEKAICILQIMVARLEHYKQIKPASSIKVFHSEIAQTKLPITKDNLFCREWQGGFPKLKT